MLLCLWKFFIITSGLSKEGWSITKNLLTELLLLTFAFLTFVPAIQVCPLLAFFFSCSSSYSRGLFRKECSLLDIMCWALNRLGQRAVHKYLKCQCCSICYQGTTSLQFKVPQFQSPLVNLLTSALLCSENICCGQCTEIDAKQFCVLMTQTFKPWYNELQYT